MSISLKDFESGDFEKERKLSKETKIDKILQFLKANQKAYTVDELSKILKIVPNTVRHSLGQLKMEDEITHKTPYFAYRR